MLAVVVTVLTAGTVILVLASSSGAGTPVPVTSLDEVTGTWEADTAEDASTELVAPVRITFASGGLFVETGCNTGRGAAEVADSALVIGTLATTRKACQPPLDEQERWVLEMLDSAPRMGLVGDAELTLSWDPDHTLVLTRVAEGSGDGPSPRV